MHDGNLPDTAILHHNIENIDAPWLEQAGSFTLRDQDSLTCEGTLSSKENDCYRI